MPGVRISSHSRSLLGEGIFFLALGAALIAYSRKLWTSDTAISMSPYLFPFMTGIVLLLLAAFLLGQSRVGADEDSPATNKVSRKTNWKGVSIVAGFSVLYFVLLPFLHFIIATILFLFGLLFALGERRHWFSALVSVGTTAIIYLTFGVLLAVMLP